MGFKDAFGFLVRAAGGVFAVFASFDLLHVAARLFGWETPSGNGLGVLIAGTIYFAVVGFLLLRYADYVVAFSYPRINRREGEN